MGFVQSPSEFLSLFLDEALFFFFYLHLQVLFLSLILSLLLPGEGGGSSKLPIKTYQNSYTSV